jgi:hypothetical protein
MFVRLTKVLLLLLLLLLLLFIYLFNSSQMFRKMYLNYDKINLEKLKPGLTISRCSSNLCIAHKFRKLFAPPLIGGSEH